MTTINDRTLPEQEAPAAAFAPVPFRAAPSIFHERWWLDIATQGNWKLAVVEHNTEVIGEMPYAMQRRGLWHVSRLPPLTRTLGPVIKPVTGSAARQLHYRLDVTGRLIEQ